MVAGALWFLMPRGAPGLVLGQAGRTVCAAAAACAVAPEDECREVLAQSVVLTDTARAAVHACSACLRQASCGAWAEQDCRAGTAHCRDGRRRRLTACEAPCATVLPATSWPR